MRKHNKIITYLDAQHADKSALCWRAYGAQGDTCLRDCNSWCLVGTRLYALARVPTWYQKKKAASLI